tara:strand:+ start:313 stop:495 length:183 start_codon:yes stop_codon:yes gene_type:complete
MNKKEVVELESAFLEFMKKAEDLGFYFSRDSIITAKHNTGTVNQINTEVKLVPNDYLKDV